MIRAVTEADAEAIYQLLFAARNQIPLIKIETDSKDGWLDLIRSWCAYNRSLVVELDGKVVSVMIVTARTHLSTGNGEVVPSDWELFYGTTRKEYRGQKLFKALFLKAIEPFETIYAQVHPGNKSEMAKTLLRWGFTEEARSYNGTVEFKLTRDR
jgi:hypothetical protein